MISSLNLYGRYIAGCLRNNNFGPVLKDLKRYRKENILASVPEYSPEVLEKSLFGSVTWLLKAQEAMPDDGFGSYHLANGWSSSYPETSGYIIPTLIHYAMRVNDHEIRENALKAADWLLSIQKPSGGWQGKRIADNEKEVVFNTAQVIRGLNASYKNTLKPHYLEASVKACEWLCSIQHDQGYWKEFASMNVHRVYDSYVDVPLLETYEITGESKFRQAAVKNLDWIISKKQNQNGWFSDCDNTIKHNDRPILHTIGYTIDGLLECGRYLDDENLFVAARKSADVLLEQFLTSGRMYGRYDHNWQGSEYFICTGGAQMAIVWSRIYNETLVECYMEAAARMIDLLIFIQGDLTEKNRDNTGALPGSFPLWGKYEPFAYPNWATKYLADALMMSNLIA